MRGFQPTDNAGIFLAGCEVQQQQSAEPYSDISTDGLRLQLEVEPAEITVNPGEKFTVTYSVQNNNPEKVELVSGCTAFARGMVFHQEEVVGLQGSSDGCFTAISSYEIPAGKKLKLAGGWRYRNARRPELYREIIGRDHNPETKPAWMKDQGEGKDEGGNTA